MFAKFYFENKALIEPLEKFQNNFGTLSANEWAALAPQLDAKFPEVPMGISLSLSMALTPGKNASDLIKAVSVGFNTKDPEVLKQKIEALSQAVQELKPELYEEAGPATRPSVPAPESAKPVMDYMKFYAEEIEGNDEMVEAYIPLFNLYYALKRNPEKFKEKDQAEQLFSGLSKPEVLIELDGLLGTPGIAEAMEASAKAGKGDHVKIALIKAIAEKRGLVGKPEELKRELLNTKSVLASRFPRLLENLG